MENLYEALGVDRKSTTAEIEAAYQRQAQYFKEVENDESMKTYSDYIKLAYKTLVNSTSRQEYDLYISQNVIHEERM